MFSQWSLWCVVRQRNSRKNTLSIPTKFCAMLSFMIGPIWQRDATAATSLQCRAWANALVRGIGCVVSQTTAGANAR